jgi:hypothetical protein
MNPSHTFEIHTVTESSGEHTVALMKNTNGVLLRAFCYMISSLLGLCRKWFIG